MTTTSSPVISFQSALNENKDSSKLPSIILPTVPPAVPTFGAGVVTHIRTFPTAPPQREIINIPAGVSLEFKKSNSTFTFPSQIVASAEGGSKKASLPPGLILPPSASGPVVVPSPGNLFGDPSLGESPGSGAPGDGPPGGKSSSPGSGELTLNSILNAQNGQGRSTSKPLTPPSVVPSAPTTTERPTTLTGKITLQIGVTNHPTQIATTGAAFSFPSQLVKKAEEAGVIKPFIRPTPKPQLAPPPELLTPQPPPGFLPGNRCQHAKDVGPCSGRFIRWYNANSLPV